MLFKSECQYLFFTRTPAMTDQETPGYTALPTRPAAPPARPKQPSHRGRSVGPSANSNQESEEIQEFEPFMLLPRGPPPLNGELDPIPLRKLLYLNCYLESI